MSRRFIEKVLGEINTLSSHEWLENGLCKIELNNGNCFTVGFVWQKHVTLATTEGLINHLPDFIASVPSGAFWDGAVMMECEEKSIGWGGIGTLTSACMRGDLSNETEKTTKFARRLLKQHGNIISLEYINSLVMVAHTKKGAAIRIALCNDYDISADSVRSSREELGEFDVLLKNNPYGLITPDAQEAARQLGSTILDSSSVHGYLWKH